MKLPGKDSFFLKKFIQILNQEMIPLEIIDTQGNHHVTAQENIRHRLLIRDPKFFNALIRPDAFSLGEAYVKGYFDVSGSMQELYEMVCERLLNTDQKKGLLSIFSRLFVKTKQKEKENIEYHYNVPSAFYRKFLGPTMGYTCGYYAEESSSMDDAQIEKMDIICRKLQLKKGEHLLDIGCGWGNFVIYAAKNYQVKATGITLSSEQKKYAERWIASEGLSKEITIQILNYRDLAGMLFDKISCVGMSEHVGKANMKHFYRVVENNLKPGGLFLQHTITTNVYRKKGFENSFLDQYMFPGGELMFENDLISQASGSGLELINAENFRPHYIRTLADWILRMEKDRDQLLEIVSDKVYRIYHVFFIGSMIAFQQKNIALYQNLFYKPVASDFATEPFLSPYSRNEKRIA